MQSTQKTIAYPQSCRRSTETPRTQRALRPCPWKRGIVFGLIMPLPRTPVSAPPEEGLPGDSPVGSFSRRMHTSITKLAQSSPCVRPLQTGNIKRFPNMLSTFTLHHGLSSNRDEDYLAMSPLGVLIHRRTATRSHFPTLPGVPSAVLASYRAEIVCLNQIMRLAGWCEWRNNCCLTVS